jgi:hypothetical protein
MDCGEQESVWSKCLAKSGRNPAKCAKAETELRKCGNAVKKDFCIDETVNLMNCTKAPDGPLCASQFVAYRECHRPQGRELVLDGSSTGYAVVEAAKQFYPEQHILRIVPEKNVNLKQAAEEYARSLGLLGGVQDLRF